MPITQDQMVKIKLYSKDHGIPCFETPPSSYTSTLRKKNILTVELDSADKIADFLQFISELNKKTDAKISAAAIGGGRGASTNHLNNSYSINQKIRDGIDVYIHLTATPTIKINEETSTCMISSNIMLLELSRELHQKGYHCPEIRGCLPVMSYGGGLATQSHSSVSSLSDIVLSLEVILPNGQKRIIKKGDPDFALMCGPTLGLLGIVTSIEIEVKPGPKNLKRSVTSVSLEDLPNYIKNAPLLQGHGIMFSSVGTTSKSLAKITTWQFVDEKETPKAPGQVVDDSMLGRYGIPFFVMNQPGLFSWIFHYVVLRENMTVVSRPDKIMGPEFKVLGRITEIGLWFEYDSTKMETVLQLLLELLQQKSARGEFPVNTSIFIRFPKHHGKTLVAFDFVSLGENLPGPRMLVSEMRKILAGKNIPTKVHFGKSDAMPLQVSDDSWKTLKGQYEDFYKRHGLDRDILQQRIAALEKDPSKISENSSTLFKEPTGKIKDSSLPLRARL